MMVITIIASNGKILVIEGDFNSFLLQNLLVYFANDVIVEPTSLVLLFGRPMRLNNKCRRNLSQLASQNSVLLQSLKVWLLYLKEDDYFLCVNHHINKTEQNKLGDYLFLLKHSDLDMNWLKSIKQYEPSAYNITVYDKQNYPKVNDNVIHKQQEHRTCLFCGRDVKQGATFRKKAHAISESLGNKILVQFDECDSCNESFSIIEKDIATYFEPFRIMFKVVGKRSVPRAPNIFFEDGKLNLLCENINKSGDSFDINFPSREAVNLQNIYKCFVLYFISLYGKKMPISDIQVLANWLKGPPSQEKLPLIHHQIYPSMFKMEPSAICYERTANDITLPKYVFEFHFLCFVFIIVIPFIDGESKYLSTSDFKLLWQHIPYWPELKKWASSDFSSPVPKVINYHWIFKKRTSE